MTHLSMSSLEDPRYDIFAASAAAVSQDQTCSSPDSDTAATQNEMSVLPVQVHTWAVAWYVELEYLGMPRNVLQQISVIYLHQALVKADDPRGAPAAFFLASVRGYVPNDKPSLSLARGHSVPAIRAQR